MTYNHFVIFWLFDVKIQKKNQIYSN